MFQRNKLQNNKVLKLRTEPWIDNDIQRLMSYRDKLFNKMTQSPTHQINIYIPSSGTVLCPNKGKVKLDIFKTILRQI